jgi:GTPase SAR1 family protein
MQEIMKNQIEDIRDRILNYRVVQNRQSTKLNYDMLPNHIDILLFGPAGSGKSSLIRTFYRSLN